MGLTGFHATERNKREAAQKKEQIKKSADRRGADEGYSADNIVVDAA